MNNDVQLKRSRTLIFSCLQIIGILSIMLLGGCFDFLNMKFDFTQLQTKDYWNDVILQSTMYSMALVIGYLGRLEKELIKNKEFEMAMILYHRFLSEKTESFIPYINKILNPKIKKEYYILRIEKKLYRLEELTKRKDEWKLEYDHYLDFLIDNSDKTSIDFQFSSKKAEKYIRKRITLEALIKDDRVDRNCQSFNRYPRVNAHAFTWGIRSKVKGNNQYKVESTLGKDLSFAIIKKIMQVVLIALFIGSFFFDPSKNELLDQVNGVYKLIVKYLIRVCSIITSYISGLYLGKKLFENNYLQVVHNRNDILEEYISWKKTLKEEETEGYKIKKLLLMKEVESIINKPPLVLPDEKLNQVDLTDAEKQFAIEQALNEKRKSELLKQALE